MTRFCEFRKCLYSSVVRSNEKPSVYNSFATLHRQNPVKSRTFSSQNDNLSSLRDNLCETKFNMDFKLLRTLVLGSFLYVHILYHDQNGHDVVMIRFCECRKCLYSSVVRSNEKLSVCNSFAIDVFLNAELW